MCVYVCLHIYTITHSLKWNFHIFSILLKFLNLWVFKKNIETIMQNSIPHLFKKIIEVIHYFLDYNSIMYFFHFAFSSGLLCSKANWIYFSVSCYISIQDKIDISLLSHFMSLLLFFSEAHFVYYCSQLKSILSTKIYSLIFFYTKLP